MKKTRDRIKLEIAKQGTNKSILSKKIGKTWNGLHNYLGKDRNINLDTFLKLLDALGLELSLKCKKK